MINRNRSKKSKNRNSNRNKIRNRNKKSKKMKGGAAEEMSLTINPITNNPGKYNLIMSNQHETGIYISKEGNKSKYILNQLIHQEK